MSKKIFVIYLIFISFVINYIWENLHFSLYSSNTLGFQSVYSLMLYASFIDTLVIVLAYLLFAVIFKEFYWSKKKRIFLFAVLAIFISLIIEIRALILGRWIYTELMPTLFGIGLSPLVQLAISGSIAIIIAEKLINS